MDIKIKDSIVYIMSWSWYNITFDIQEASRSIAEASSRPRSREQVVYGYTKNKWSDEHVPPHEGITIMFGGGRIDKIKGYIQEYFEEFNFINGAAVVFVTDDGHCGHGWVFKNKDGNLELLNEYDGYAKAEGHDVAGMISEDYSIKAVADRMW